MTVRVRLLVVLARPAVVVLLALYAAIGLAQGGHRAPVARSVDVLLAVAAYLVASVAVNDIADERIDRINLARDRRRPLVTGSATRNDMVVAAGAAAAIALGAGALLGSAGLLVVAAGLLLSGGYSLRPVRIADRGAVAAMVLPAGYVAVPYLLGAVGAHHPFSTHGMLLLGALYIGFIGRILLKDFRDVVGDALFGKRTFLVRHGRRTTCLVSGICCSLGLVLSLLAAPRRSDVLLGSYVLGGLALLALLWALSRADYPRRDDTLIATIAVVGRGLLVLLLAQFSLPAAGLARLPSDLLLGSLAALTTGQALTMLRYGPRTGLTVPHEWSQNGVLTPEIQFVSVPTRGQLG